MRRMIHRVAVASITTTALLGIMAFDENSYGLPSGWSPIHRAGRDLARGAEKQQQPLEDACGNTYGYHCANENLTKAAMVPDILCKIQAKNNPPPGCYYIFQNDQCVVCGNEENQDYAPTSIIQDVGKGGAPPGLEDDVQMKCGQDRSIGTCIGGDCFNPSPDTFQCDNPIIPSKGQ
jgi:hypothetical protein